MKVHVAIQRVAGGVHGLDIQSATPVHYGTGRGSVTNAVRFRRSLELTEPVHLEKTRLTV